MLASEAVTVSLLNCKRCVGRVPAGRVSDGTLGQGVMMWWWRTSEVLAFGSVVERSLFDGERGGFGWWAGVDGAAMRSCEPAFRAGAVCSGQSRWRE